MHQFTNKLGDQRFRLAAHSNESSAEVVLMDHRHGLDGSSRITSQPSFKEFDILNVPIPTPLEMPTKKKSIDLHDARLEDFIMIDTLGTGTFGSVRLCKYAKTEQNFCIKIINKARIVRLKQQDHILSEKQVLSSISHHFIVKL